MTFKYDTSLGDNVSLVRFHIGDTNEDGHYLEDETIAALITLQGTVAKAVIACIKYIISQLSVPNFRLDWMSISNEQARAGYESLLKQKRIELGVRSLTMSSTVSFPHRADSYENKDGIYTDPTGLP